MRIRQKEKDETTETRIVKKTLKLLRKEGGFWVKTHGGPFQKSGLPDILGCWKGRFVGFEVKRPGKNPTEIQKNTIKEIIKAGGIAKIVTSVDEVLNLIKGVKTHIQ
jgi:Holliday junction resolvase